MRCINRLGTAMGSRLLIPGLMMLLASLPAAAQMPQGTIEYYHTDAVGSVRAVTDAQGNFVRRHDYFPFGEEFQAQNGSDSRRFTGKERDAETGLDYFGARYYGSQSGRFTTVDPVLAWEASLQRPQLWNRHSYGVNNPLRFVDPDGRCVWDLCVGEATLLYGAAAAASAGWLTSPAGQQAVRQVVSDTRTVITAAVEGVRSLFVESRRANDFSPGTKKLIDKENAEKYGGQNVCEECGTETVPGKKSEVGVRPAGNQRERDHITPASKGGSKDASNGLILCRDCNLAKGNKVKRPDPEKDRNE